MSALEFGGKTATTASHTPYHCRYGVGQSGFSLIEVLIVITIIAIVAMLAAPSIKESLERQRNKELSQSIVSALKEARNEALFRHQSVKVEYSATGLVVSQTIAPKGKNPESPVIRTYPLSQGGLIAPDSDIITFSPNKSVSFARSGSSTGKIETNCNADGKKGRTIQVDKVGNITVNAEDSQC